jgi:hypothetical protein
MCFPVGTILGSLALLARGGVRRKGRAQIASLVVGSFTLGVVGFGFPSSASAFRSGARSSRSSAGAWARRCS